MSSGLAALCLLLLHTGALGFKIVYTSSQSHQEITERAILNITVQACRDLALAQGRDFTVSAQPFTPSSVVVACRARKSFIRFYVTIHFIQVLNGLVDVRHASNPEYHFDNEEILRGRNVVAGGLSAVKATLKECNFEAARDKLAVILHPLQDFYTHSNWVEMGNLYPHPNLTRPDTTLNIAAITRRTCRNCVDDDCRNNILEDILREKILTTGYFGLNPFSKPEGKCSHGGFLDVTSLFEPKGGINKDTLNSSHGYLHTEAANMAAAATSELLEDIRKDAGDKPFLQMLGMANNVLCFVIDTTGSMRDDIAAVRDVTFSIINSKVGTDDEPSAYILVPFNDPDFGPLMKTKDPEVFKDAINSLSAFGGGDLPEMSLSGLQLALSGAPSSSEIFVFTDAPAKDKELKSTVMALIGRTKSVVNFMITDVLRGRRQRRSGNNQQGLQSRLSAADAQLYRDVAQASGGQSVEVSKSELPVATSIVSESTNSALVTILQAARNPGKEENFTFIVDTSVQNLTIYITGISVNVALTSPSGVTQQSTNTTGSLIAASQSVGNFMTLMLNAEVGLWEIKMVSTNPYTLKVVGESLLDFLFFFLGESQSPFEGFDVIDNRPRAGVNGSLMVSVIGNGTANVTEVILVESSGSGEVNSSVEAQPGGDFLARFDRIPSEEFVVLMRGQNSDGAFQRQSPTHIKASALTLIATDFNIILEPGTTLSLPFSVMTDGAGGDFSIRTSNDQGFASTFPSSLTLVTGVRANGTVTITTPPDTSSGTVVTLTIEAEDQNGTDSNYVVLRLAVLRTVNDSTAPACELLSLQSNCSESSCSLSMWALSVRVTDGAEGTGVDRVSLSKGNGTFSTSLAAGNGNVTLVSYSASCCSPDMEMLVVDQVGNVGTCAYSVSTRAAQSVLLCLSIMILGFSLHF